MYLDKKNYRRILSLTLPQGARRFERSITFFPCAFAAKLAMNAEQQTKWDVSQESRSPRKFPLWFGKQQKTPTSHADVARRSNSLENSIFSLNFQKETLDFLQESAVRTLPKRIFFALSMQLSYEEINKHWTIFWNLYLCHIEVIFVHDYHWI